MKKQTYFLQYSKGTHICRCYIQPGIGQKLLNEGIIESYVDLCGATVNYLRQVDKIDSSYNVYELPSEKFGAKIGYESAVQQWKMKSFQKINQYGMVH